MLFPLLSLPLCHVAFKTLEASGLNVTMEDVRNTDHFSIIEQLVDGEYHLTKVHVHTKQRLLEKYDQYQCPPLFYWFEAKFCMFMGCRFSHY